jgi:N-formylglutamate deformylase
MDEISFDYDEGKAPAVQELIGRMLQVCLE